jgi:hypothetical protein
MEAERRQVVGTQGRAERCRIGPRQLDNVASNGLELSTTWPEDADDTPLTLVSGDWSTSTDDSLRSFEVEDSRKRQGR